MYIELPKIIIIFNIIYIYTDKFESIERPSVFKNALTNDSLLNNKYNIIYIYSIKILFNAFNTLLHNKLLDKSSYNVSHMLSIDDISLQ